MGTISAPSSSLLGLNIHTQFSLAASTLLLVPLRQKSSGGRNSGGDSPALSSQPAEVSSRQVNVMTATR